MLSIESYPWMQPHDKRTMLYKLKRRAFIEQEQPQHRWPDAKQNPEEAKAWFLQQGIDVLAG